MGLGEVSWVLFQKVSAIRWEVRQHVSLNATQRPFAPTPKSQDRVDLYVFQRMRLESLKNAVAIPVLRCAFRCG